METIQDFLKELKNRLTNPLISSFIIAWLFWNWQIVIALVFYKITDLKQDGYSSYYDLINSRQNTWKMIVYPLIGACIYTFGFPYLTAWVKLLNAKIKSRNDTEILAATKSDTMPMKRFLKLLDQHNETSQNLKRLIEREEETINENVNLKAEALDLTSTIKKHEQTLTDVNDTLLKYKGSSTLSNLLGKWQGSVAVSNVGHHNGPEVWEFKNTGVQIGDTEVKIREYLSNPLELKYFIYLAKELNAAVKDLLVISLSEDLSTMRVKSHRTSSSIVLTRIISTPMSSISA